MPAAIAPHRPCTPEERAALRAPLTSGGYHGVYLQDRAKPNPRYVAKPFRKRRVGVYRTPREAAAAVAGWWRDRYGADWPAHFHARRRPGWEAVRVPLGDRPGWATGFDLLDGGWGEGDDLAGRPAARTGPAPPAVWTRAGGGWVRKPGRAAAAAYAAVAWPGGVPTVVHPPAAGDLFATAQDVRAAVVGWVRRQAAAGTPVELLPARMPPPLERVGEGSHSAGAGPPEP